LTYVVRVAQACDFYAYVGAFWRKEETGERIIRIYAGADPANRGAWMASVEWMDSYWNSGDVRLSTDMLDETSLAARGISYTSEMNPDAPENYQVAGGASVSGVLEEGECIMFRIGLGSNYTPAPNRPARYAVIRLSYANHTKEQKIYLRQGDDADYLMHPNDPITGGTWRSDTRPAAKKFATYNLTAPALPASVPYRGAIFTQYPSQAGAWTNWRCQYSSGIDVKLRYLINHTYTGGYLTALERAYWNDISGVNEISPDGFRRPYEGTITANTDNESLDQREMSQSLLQYPKKDNGGLDYTSDITNSVWGYYADGFFDRRRIVNSPTGAALTSVAVGDLHIAHIGRLFFNPRAASSHYNASIFFPAAGKWGSSPPYGNSVGTHAIYYAAGRTLPSSQNAFNMRVTTMIFNKEYTYIDPTYNGSDIASIRPVVDE